MAAAKRKNEDKSLTILRELITHNGNKYCFDCSQRGPTYVNMTIGSFVCSKCSGMLRGLTPPHRVKSISMATFTPGEIDQIKNQGNDYCKSIWLGLYEGSVPVFKDEQSLRDHMSEKYEKKRYYLDPSFAMKQRKPVEKPVTSINQKSNAKESGIWNSSSSRNGSSNIIKSLQPVTKPSTSTQNTSGFNNSFQLLSTVITNTNNQSNSIVPCPEFPVDFSSADIFNSSQMNNNFIQTISSPPVNSFDFTNSNTVTHDRYAALADLDLALRQQCQNQAPVENKQSNSANPFDVSPFSESSKNPFSTNPTVNGNSYFSNPFSMGFNTTQPGQSKNPFL